MEDYTVAQHSVDSQKVRDGGDVVFDILQTALQGRRQRLFDSSAVNHDREIELVKMGPGRSNIDLEA